MDDVRSIWLNGRTIPLESITRGEAAAQSAHEQNVIDFVSTWCSPTDEFRLQTSGSTGTPKTITVTRQQMIASARLTGSALNLNEGDRSLLCIDSRYIGGKMMIVRSFVLHLNLFVVDPSADPTINLPKDLHIDFAALVPYQIRYLIDVNRLDVLRQIKKGIIGGAPLDESSAMALADLPGSFYETYGMTETISHIALRKITKKDSEKVFKVLPGVKISTDDRGCLVIEAPFLINPITTNDLVEIFNSEMFSWRGRADNIINSGGVKISPEELEEKIGQIFTRSHLLNKFFIHAAADARLGQRVVLVLEAAVADVERLRQAVHSISHSLVSYEVPKEIYFTEHFIYTPTGKINRSESFGRARRVTPL